MGTSRRLMWLMAALCLTLCAFSASAQQALFPGTTACQRCANDSTQCGDAYKGIPGKYCGPWLSSGVKQACCCPPTARCVIPINAASCGCDSDPTPINKPTTSSSKTPFWVWILVGVGVLALAVVIWRCCCVTVYEPEPVYVPAGGVTYVGQQPVVVQQPYGGYGYGNGYGNGGNMAAGVAIGATAGIVGGVLIGEALADHGDHGNYYGGGGGGDYGGGGGGGGGADFGGDF
ncbi:hypothetical protein H257_16895 [Aphanomyces astaci]|uniref:Uncharacterized protein n=1 Tax=Aphanomyces astaci TaxID=112090 RepID=W4FGP8_APHAT|nr:hypothetical protein H257_16895 [Aphanomyces astaci]ETV66682.1 hypothetical protein H257_16895 [Aphanomyces astaci]|eukprot:XP_009843807.1 hypothetical protein H257_16895 [Aphanomyces astaci]